MRLFLCQASVNLVNIYFLALLYHFHALAIALQAA